MKEIGGYFGLEEFVRGEYYPELLKFNLGRTALLYLLEKIECKKLLLPYYVCDSVSEYCEKASCKIEYYHVDEDLNPQISDESLGEKEYLYLINYYGQLTDKKILFYKEKYGNIIVDHTHSFFQKPLQGVMTLYSCRKFFGLPDGAYLSADFTADELESDVSKERMEHILGRYEGKASDYYSIMLKNASDFHKAPVKRMSRLTENLLNVVDYDRVKRKRNENYECLKKYLGDVNSLNFITPDGPLAYPFYNENAAKIRKELAGKKIYVPVYWGNVIEKMPQDSIEYKYAKNIMPIPCDQRYSTEDMKYVADTLLKILENKNG